MSKKIEHYVLELAGTMSVGQEAEWLDQVSSENGGRWTLRAVVRTEAPREVFTTYYFTRGAKR